jgi:hypothetical protein
MFIIQSQFLVKMKAIIYPQFNGIIGVIYPTENTDIETLVKNLLPDGTPHTVVDNLKIDGALFDAYEYSSGGPVFNVSKAHALWKNKWRKIRDLKLQQLDIEFLRAVETGDSIKQKNISQQKQLYRDVTNIELPDTPDQIKSVWPEILR